MTGEELFVFCGLFEVLVFRAALVCLLMLVIVVVAAAVAVALVRMDSWLVGWSVWLDGWMDGQWRARE